MDGWISSIMATLGYWGVAFLMFVENIFPPIPSELIMPLAGFTAGRGDLSIWGVIAAGSLGSVAGQYPLYYLGRALGQRRLHRLADRYGKWVTVSGADIDRAGAWLNRRGPIAILLCRLIPGVRSLISIPAGIARMNLVVFTLYSAVGIGDLAGRGRRAHRLARLARPRLRPPLPRALPVPRRAGGGRGIGSHANVRRREIVPPRN